MSFSPTAFKEKQRYTFQYQTEVVHSIPGAASKQIGLQLQCSCHVTFVKITDPAEAQIKVNKMLKIKCFAHVGLTYQFER